MLALSLVVIAVLALIGLSLRSLQSNRKVNDTVVGQLVAEQALERLAQQAETSTAATFWSNDSLTVAYQTDVVSQSNTVLTVSIYASDVPALGTGFASDKKLKYLEAVVQWQNAAQGKAGMGNLMVRANRLVHQP